MINEISIKGYKCLFDVVLETSSLNVLVGANASGKSSLIQLMLLLRQSANKDGVIEDLHLSGPLYEAGTVQDILHPSSEYKIEVDIKDNNRNENFSFLHDRETKDAHSKRILTTTEAKKLPDSIYIKGNSFAYLNAERIGPRVTYPLSPDDHQLDGMVGKQGEFTTALLARAAEGIMVDGWCDDLASNLAEPAEKLDGFELYDDLINSQGRLDLVTNILLGWIIPGAMFDVVEQSQIDTAALRYVRDPDETKTTVRATHIGFGLTYTLPIITAALALDVGGILLIENPEAHLHPYSQSRMGIFLSLLASSNRQIFIETHSDHIINGIRLAITKGYISNEVVKINYFDKSRSSDKTTVTPIQSDPNGRLDNWPHGFFDQIENDLSKL